MYSRETEIAEALGMLVSAIMLLILVIWLLRCVSDIRKNTEKTAEYILPIFHTLSKIQETLQKGLDLHERKTEKEKNSAVPLRQNMLNEAEMLTNQKNDIPPKKGEQK